MISAAKQEEAQAQTEVKQSQMQLQHCQKELAEKQHEMRHTATEYQKDKRNLENMEKERDSLEVCFLFNLSPWCRAFLEKLTVIQMVKEFLAFVEPKVYHQVR
jgi:SUMO ligase MMS21 Smc5/6 complex component